MNPNRHGGPAFPLEKSGGCPSCGSAGYSVSHGMTLRDYFAIHCDQPGEAEIVTAAGLKWDQGLVVAQDRDGTVRRSFSQWWWTIPQSRRFELYAQVRYALADAMLKARDEA